jgi:hypothetical protein
LEAVVGVAGSEQNVRFHVHTIWRRLID